MATPAIVHPGTRPAVGNRWVLAGFCLISGIACLAGRWIPGGMVVRIVYGLVVAALLLAVALMARRRPAPAFSSLAFAFFAFAVVQLLNNSVPLWLGTTLLHRPPVTGDPLGSTVSATVWIQLLETAIAAVPILLLARWWGEHRSDLYLEVGKIGRWQLVAVAVFIACYVVTAAGLTGHLFPVRAPVSLERFLTLTPVLLVLCLSNGFQEELLFRGLFLRRYQNIFGPVAGNLLQATIFAIAHAGVVYTPIAFVFLFVVAFPLGLIAGFLMRRTRGMLAPVIFHAGLDIPIYFAFLSYVIHP
ncbi:MAG TPA: CPBP family intramembrane glutamic endopeptidase [Microlunatus sp.]|nr:CPBP family intramembrane glutamic endopeptidase [Microlunatus sp.]